MLQKNNNNDDTAGGKIKIYLYIYPRSTEQTFLCASDDNLSKIKNEKE